MAIKSACRIFVAPALCVVALLLLPVDAPAQDSPDSYAFDIHLIEASNGKPGVDPEIKEIADRLQTQYPYSTYSVFKKISTRISVGETQSFPMPGEHELTLQVSGHKGKQVELTLGKAKTPDGQQPRLKVTTDVTTDCNSHLTDFKFISPGTTECICAEGVTRVITMIGGLDDEPETMILAVFMTK